MCVVSEVTYLFHALLLPTYCLLYLFTTTYKFDAAAIGITGGDEMGNMGCAYMLCIYVHIIFHISENCQIAF